MILTKQTSKLSDGSEVYNLKVDDDDIVVTFDCNSRESMDALVVAMCRNSVSIEEVRCEVQD
jgi:Cft2 family RNA processing exonuclease